MAKKETLNIFVIKGNETGNETGNEKSFPKTPNTPPPPKTK